MIQSRPAQLSSKTQTTSNCPSHPILHIPRKQSGPSSNSKACSGEPSGTTPPPAPPPGDKKKQVQVVSQLSR